MKKFLVFLFMVAFTLIPMNLKAVTADSEKMYVKDYQTAGFKEILTEEGMTLKNTNYTETEDQAVIYLFRGNGCAYCRAFLEFLNSISDEYGKYFRVVGFEVWYNADNGDVLKNISEFMGSSASGVPFIIIGDQVFPGYAASYDDSIKEAIKTAYDNNNKYDAFEEYNKAIDAAIWEKNKVIYISVFCNVIICAVAVYITMRFIKKQNQLLLDEIRKTTKPTKAVEVKPAVVEKKKTKKRK